jgi:hypothetical protein
MLDIYELCNLNTLSSIFRVVKLRGYNGQTCIKNFLWRNLLKGAMQRRWIVDCKSESWD